MSLFAVTFLIALAASVALTAGVRGIARRWKIVDHPDGNRKLHTGAIPLWGGVAVYLAMVLGLLAAGCGSAPGGQFAELSTALIIAAGLVCFVGSLDDYWNIPARLKLALQIVAVLPIVLFGYAVDRVVVFGCPIELGWIGVPLTVLWLVGCINALNLIDGMDGLASIVGVSTAAMLGLIAAGMGNDHVALVAIALAGALAGFLVYNLPPASIFLGDSGSMVIGLTVGVLGIQGALKTSATLSLTAPAVVMTLPMFDILAAIIRRKLTGQRFDAADRLHIHHRLLARGWNPWQVLCLLGAVCLTTGAAATAATIFRKDALAWITALTAVVLSIRLRLFGHHEFALLKNAVADAIRHGLRRLVRSGSARETSPVAHALPFSFEEGWAALVRAIEPWQVCLLELTISDGRQPHRRRWLDPAAARDSECRWSIVVSLPGDTGRLCELCASGADAPRREAQMHDLTKLLQTYGEHFAESADQILGRLDQNHSESETQRDQQRIAA